MTANRRAAALNCAAFPLDLPPVTWQILSAAGGFAATLASLANAYFTLRMRVMLGELRLEMVERQHNDSERVRDAVEPLRESAATTEVRLRTLEARAER
jgi:hypothetical protein